MLLHEFNLLRGVIDFDPFTGNWETKDIRDYVDKGYFSAESTDQTPFRGEYADLANHRFFLYRTEDLKHVIFQDDTGFRIELDPSLVATIKDQPSPKDKVLREFKILDRATQQTRYIAVYDALPILQGFWQDFTPYMEYKRWDFYESIVSTLEFYGEEGMPDWYEGPAPADYFERLAQPLITDPQRIPAGQAFPQAGFWFTPSQMNSRRYFKQGDTAPMVASDYGEVLWLWDKNQSVPSMN